MNTALRERLTQFHRRFQHELVPLVETDVGQTLTPVMTRLLRIWERVEIERFVPSTSGLVGRPPRERLAVARAFVAKAVLGLTQTSDLVERLNADAVLRRLCGFDLRRKGRLNESLFSRAYAEFTEQGLPARVHEALIRTQLGDALIGHVSRDATAIQAREQPVKAEPAPAPRKRGRPRKGEVRPPKPETRLERQTAGMSLPAMLAELPKVCDVGAKKNSQGFRDTWIGYKLHLDVADGMIPIAAILTSASVHDSQVAIPLATLSAQRVTSLYDVMDAAYCSPLIRAHSRSLGHVPLIDHNPRGGEKIEFAPHEAQRFKERSTVERVNARLKDEFGACRINVRGPAKVMTHLMFAVLVLAADQLLRWVT
ncbi:MAG: transposase [Tepidisphaeraceae bacterium]